jgi:hypothetical protein
MLSLPWSANRRSKVFCARFRGLIKAWAILDGSISFPGPRITFPVPRTCPTPLFVSSRSVVPVKRPDFDHSVSPGQDLSAEKSTWYLDLRTMSGQENTGSARVFICHDKGKGQLESNKVMSLSL